MAKRPKADQRADTRGKPFAGLPHVVMESEAYRLLTPIARAILFELVRRFNGYNNGKIGMSVREMARALGRRDMKPIAPAINQLWQHGLVDFSEDRPWKERQAREYRLTFVSTGTPPHTKSATNEYLTWKPEAQNSATPVVAEKASSATTGVTEAPDAVTTGVAGTNGNQPKTPLASATTGVTLISKPYPSAKSGGAGGKLNGHSASLKSRRAIVARAKREALQ